MQSNKQNPISLRTRVLSVLSKIMLIGKQVKAKAQDPAQDSTVQHTNTSHGGNRPCDYGMSAQCHKMRRQNKLRSLGLGGQKI